MKLTAGKIPAAEHKKLWTWLDAKWREAGNDEAKKLEVIMKGINSTASKFQQLDILNKINNINVKETNES